MEVFVHNLCIIVAVIGTILAALGVINLRNKEQKSNLKLNLFMVLAFLGFIVIDVSVVLSLYSLNLQPAFEEIISFYGL